MNRPIEFPPISGSNLLELQRYLRSRTIEGGLRQRALLIWELSAGFSLAEASEMARLHYTNAHKWVRRFLSQGIDGLQDQARSGRPRIYHKKQTTVILQVALARPEDLGLDFTTWSLPKLEEYLQKRKGLKNLSRETIRRRLLEAGLRFRAGQTWCESDDPQFEQKKTKS